MGHDMSPREPYNPSDQQSYQPSRGEPVRHNFKGYYNDPDMQSPGSRLQTYSKDRPDNQSNTRRYASITKMEPGEFEAPKRHFTKGADGVWKTPEEAARELQAKRQEEEKLLQFSRQQQREQAEARERRRRQDLQEFEKCQQYDPFRPNNQDSKAFHKMPLSIEKEQAGKRMTEVQGFATYTPQPDNMDVLNRINYQQKGYHRYEYRDNAAQQLQEKSLQRRNFRTTLQEQIEERARESMRAAQKEQVHETPLASNLGNVVNPAKREDGRIVAHRVHGGLTEGRKPVSKDLAAQLQSQAEIDAHRRQMEREEVRRDQLRIWHPFEQSPIDGKEVRRTYVFSNGIDIPNANPVDGTSLINSMPRGENHHDPVQKKAPSIAKESYKVELEAQKRGQSEFGRSGAGAPVRLADGSYRTHMPPSAEDDFTGDLEDRMSPEYRQRRASQLREQEEFMRQRDRVLREERERSAEQVQRAQQERDELDRVQKAERKRNGRPEPRTIERSNTQIAREQQKREYGAYLRQQTEEHKRAQKSMYRY